MLGGIADPNLDTANAAAAQFGLAGAYATVEQMLAAEQPDACLVLTPVSLNASMAIEVSRHGIPLLMEKPLGATIEEARALVAALRASDARVMVSMNRRFAPLLRSAIDWIGTRRLHAVHATMARHRRTEAEFVEHTGLHLVDAVRTIAGDVSSCSALRYEGTSTPWFQARLAFASGAAGLINLIPDTGGNAESLQLYGEDFSVEIRSAEFDRGEWRGWAGGQLVREESLPSSTPGYIANGTLAETEAFVHALANGARFFPTPADVLPSMELCHLIAAAGPG